QVIVLLLAGRPPGGDWVWWPSVVAAAIAAIAFGPLRRSLLAVVDRAARRGPRSPETVLAGFGDRVSRGVPIDDLLVELAEAVRRGFTARRAEVWRLEGPSWQRVVSVPDGPPIVVDLPAAELAALGRVGTAGEAWLGLWAPTLAAARLDDRVGVTVRLAPARHGGAVLGAVVVERDAGDGPFGTHEDRALGELGRRLGDLLRNRQLDQALGATLADLRVANADLRASRARLVATADAERRRLERDLHDGAQQQLVALTLNLGLARDTVLSDPQGTVETLDRLAADARLAIDQLRELARGIYPPLLLDLGLAGALAAVARRSPQPVTVDATGAGRAAPDTEATVYFCCLEALQNVAKHAPQATVAITVADGPTGMLTFTVRDDGPGFEPSTVRAGHGLQNMADRVGAVGGTLAVDAVPGRGTTVTGTLPR
ncbi:MAG: histidine kinase, partial [Ilumatobacteraceae bacterium]